jgi:NTF2 fold immunity protein
MKSTLTICIAVIASLIPWYAEAQRNAVPDADSAIKKAETALVPVYGRKQIDSEKPFTASLKDGVWTVAGTLHCPDGKGGTTTTCLGGVAVVKVSQSNGRIISMTHTQ